MSHADILERVAQAEKTAASCRYEGAQDIHRYFCVIVKIGFFSSKRKSHWRVLHKLCLDSGIILKIEPIQVTDNGSDVKYEEDRRSQELTRVVASITDSWCFLQW